MFEWLEDELKRIRTKKFHVVDGPISDQLLEQIENSKIRVPSSYKQFVSRFGSAKLYRQGSIYLVKVFAAPVEAETIDGEQLLHFGRAKLAKVYFKKDLLGTWLESPTYAWQNQTGLRRTANTFEEWLFSECKAARKSFGSSRWKEIEAGPEPFSKRELLVVHSRRKFRWHMAGLTDDGKIQFEVYNGSKVVIPYLSIGIASKNEELDGGGAWLPVSSILPGETKLVEKACYKGIVPPEDIEAFELPDPGPEDREQYWEFRNIDE